MRENFMGLFRFIGRVFTESRKHNITTEAAALAFYAALSLAPLLVMLLFIGGLMGPDAQDRLVHQAVRLVGRHTGEIVRQVVDSVRNERLAGTVSVALGVITLLASAMGLFAQLHSSMNKIWGVRAKKGRGWFAWFRQRAFALGMVGSAGLLMLASTAVSATLSLLFADERVLWHWVDFGISLCVHTFVFALIFKLLPDVKILWRDVFPASLVTSVFFVIGKFAIGRYLGHSGVGSAYGAAGSLVVFLAWVYYTSLIIFYGAEVAQARALHRGREIVPLKHATRE
jgi:membrane protein